MRSKLQSVSLLAVSLLSSKLALAASPIAFHQTNVLGTSMDLQVNTTSQADADAVHSAVNEEIERLRKILSAYDPACELARLNATREPVKVSSELIEVLNQYEQWEKNTDGAITAQIDELKKFYQNNPQATRQQIFQKRDEITTKLWKIDTEQSTVQRLADRTINVDSLGKGFIVSRALSHAVEKGPKVDGILLNIGGDISVTGFGVVGRKVKWTVMVADPFDTADNAKPIAEMRLTDMSVATSGGYARSIKVGDKNFSHIIDPRTGLETGLLSNGSPATTSIASATVVAKDNVTANALATALCILGPIEGLPLVKKMGAECLIITHEGRKYRSEGMKKYEIIKEEPAAQSDVAAGEGAKWPTQYSVDIKLPVLQDESTSNRPYVAIWIEDDQSHHVATLAYFGNNPKWMRDLYNWGKYFDINQKVLGKISRATRSAGEYKVNWDGKDRDGRAVPQGKYTVCVEISFEHGGSAFKTATIDCGAAPSNVKLDASRLFEAADIKYEFREGAK